jgi:hypothetical protein
MKTKLIIFIALLFSSSASFSFNVQFKILPKDVKENIDSNIVSSMFKGITPAPDLVIYYIDFNDCINCILPIKSSAADNSLNYSNCVWVANNIPKSKVKYVKNLLNLPDSVLIVTGNAPLIKYFSSINSKDETKRSLILKYNHTSIIEWMPLSKTANGNLLKLFVNADVKTEKEIALKNDTTFYTSIDKIFSIDNNFILKTGPSQNILKFNADGNYLGTLTLSEAVIAKFAFPYLLATFPDSVQSRKNDHLDSVLLCYFNVIKPRGFEMIRFSNYSYNNDTLYISAYISLPFDESQSSIKLASRVFIIALNKKLEFVSIKYCNINYNEKSVPLEFYGYKHVSGSEIKFAMISSDFQVRPKNYFMGTYMLDANGQYVFNGLDEKCMVADSILSPTYSKLKELVFKFDFLNDSIVYFNYVPFFFNTNTGSIIPHFSGLSANSYQLLNVDLIKHEGKNYYQCIENIDGRLFVSLITADLKERVYMKKINVKEMNISNVNGSIYNIELDGENGTILKKLSFSDNLL